MYEDLILVCEGECNPDIKEYDAICGQDRNLRSMIVDESRRLVHTKHIATTNEIYRAAKGWGREWTCAECGKGRWF